jgi:N-acetylglucosaminyl-diphospho-decaprenol L-rhamnosyltransferase
LSGSCLLLRRAAFDQIGGFDDRFFMFFEDVDLGDRLGRAGWSSVLVPEARVTHAQGASWRERPEAMIRAHHTSAWRYLAARYSRWYQWPVRMLLRAGLAARRELQVRAARRTP